MLLKCCIQHQTLEYYQVCLNDDPRLTFDLMQLNEWISGQRYRAIGPLVTLTNMTFIKIVPIDLFSDVFSDKMAQWGMMRHRGLRSVHEKRQVMADLSSIELEIVSDSYANIDRCWLLLNAEIDKAYITRPVSIDDDLAKSLSESQVEAVI